MTTLPDDLVGQIERLLAFMGEISGEAEACWVTLAGLPVEDAGAAWQPARAYYVIGRSPQPSWCNNYVNHYPRYAGAQLLLRTGRQYGVHVRVVVFRDPALPQVLLAGYVAVRLSLSKSPTPPICRRPSRGS